MENPNEKLDKMQIVMKNLEDAMVVMSYMEKRQTDRLLRQEEEMEQLAQARLISDQKVARLKEESMEFQHRTDQKLLEIADKLDGLIGYTDGQRPRPN